MASYDEFNYIQGFSTSSKKKTQSSETIGLDIIGCHNYIEFAVMNMKRKDKLEEPTQVFSNPDALLSHDQSITNTSKRKIWNENQNRASLYSLTKKKCGNGLSYIAIKGNSNQW